MNCTQKIITPIRKNVVVEQSLELRLRTKRARECLKWGAVNCVLLAILLFDISNKCPYAFSKWFYVEYVAAGIIALSLAFYFLKYFYYTFVYEPVKGTREQKSLLEFEDADNSFITTSSATLVAKPDAGSTPMNATILSWHSSFNDSNRGLASPNWSFNRTTPPRTSPTTAPDMSFNSSTQNNSFNVTPRTPNASFASPFRKYTRDEVITDEKGLQQYLKEVSKQELLISEMQSGQNTFHTTSMNSFWNYCNTAANLLKTSLYQLSPSAATVSPNKQSSKDEGGNFGNMDSDGNSEIIRKISSAKLSQYVANLRMWISITILQRLEIEISKIDSNFQSRGLSDIQIGSVGLERLKKTAENQQFVAQHVPMLPLVLPFLEMSTNQEYLVQRIKDLAQGSCIADYRWNSGSPYHGLNWDEHLPTDSAILFHIFCTYMDSQLMPLPQPGGRPFFNRYVILGDKKSVKETLAEVRNKSRCAILCTNLLKPKFNFISDNKIHNCAPDRNNLFYVIIQFLIYMKTHHEGLLEGVNLGKSGINILCVIED